MQGGEGFIGRSQGASGAYPLEKMLGPKRTFRSEIDFSQEGRIPPSAFEVEQEVLGCILLQGEAIEKVIEKFADDSDDIFYDSRHRIIYKAMLRLYTRRDPIDLITLGDELKRNEELERVGGNYYLASLSNKVVSAANVEYYAMIVKEKYLYRRLIALSSQVSKLAYEQSMDVFDLMEQTSQEVFKISQAGIKKNATHIKPLLKESAKVIELLRSRKESVTGIPSGFSDLDRLTAGFQKSDMIIIAARPSTGKTAFALSLTRHAAVEGKSAVLVFSLEMAEIQLATRMLCSEAFVESQLVRTGRISSSDMTSIVSRMDRLSQAEIYIDDTPSISIVELGAKARRMKQEKNIGMIIVDYLQLITAMKDGRTNREQEIAQISRSLKALAKELEIPVIALAQLNRSVEQRGGDRRPQLSDLRESGSIEQDADVVMFLSRPESHGIENFPDGTSTKDVIEVIIGKQRNGPIGDVRLKFLRQYGRFESMSAVYSDADFQLHEPEQATIEKAADQLEHQNQLPPPSGSLLNPEDAPF
ncbi:replicative DNA helicase [Chloroherpeton thalassium ATCC 35110]|uniref:Replicative DNA helicase n=1 Tax=Chloroherpeton thalassium (strain ATCC 35110 / GB-78) TaxID=517418 RepID=B3QUE8_CHLT3|nr:replicative DNA helicase [Chloroherpeton thalassium ATCC 35110]